MEELIVLLVASLIFWVPMVAADNGGGVAKLLGWPLCDTPVSVRWLGPNKTVAAYYMGVLLAFVAIALENYLFRLDNQSMVSQAVMVGVGSVLGDHVKSFFKRRRGIASGDPWPPWDQIDYALGGGVAALAWFYFVMSVSIDWIHFAIPVVAVVYALTTKHAGNYAFYLLGLRSRPH